MPLIDLPADIIVLVFPYLTAPDFLSFTSVTKTFLAFRQEPTFWRTLTTRTFRIPPQPLLQADGQRWQWLYKSLFTQTRAFTWGNNERYNLGHSILNTFNSRGRLRLRERHPAEGARHHIGWPTEMEHTDLIGVIADIQCGGWSTVLLNSEGQLFMVGVLDGQAFQRDFAAPTQLSFPSPYPSTKKGQYEPTTAIRQYSVGRQHILGLSDSGKIWEWTNHRFAGQHIKFASVDIVEGCTTGNGIVTKVVAGWAGSSAYVNGTGILFWNRTPALSESAETDGFLVDSITIPGTSFRRSHSGQWSNASLECRIGEVINYVVLDSHIVFITHLNKVFAYPADLDNFNPEFDPVEITTFSQYSPNFLIEDIQGSFRNFGIFSKNGAVLLGNTTLVMAFMDASHAINPPATDSLPHPIIPHALQNASVISLAFGDYHYHALHADGTISSYGRECQSCGSLGLGSIAFATARGVHYMRHAGDGALDQPDWTDGRTTVWFEGEKRLWLKSMIDQNAGTAPDSPPGLSLLEQIPTPTREISQNYSEWIEQEGRTWHLGPREYRSNHLSNVDDSGDDKGAYFAVKVTAAGWHSGALVLVDSTKAECVRQKYVVPPTPEPIPAAVSLLNPESNDRGTSELQSEDSALSLEQLSRALTACGHWLYEHGRWFLGLTARDEMNAHGSEAQGGSENTNMPKKNKKTQWVWEGKALPKLRLVGGRVMPVGEEVVGWREGQPDW